MKVKCWCDQGKCLCGETLTATAAGCCLDSAVMEGRSCGPCFICWDITGPFLSAAAWYPITWHWAALKRCGTWVEVLWRPHVYTPSVSLTHTCVCVCGYVCMRYGKCQTCYGCWDRTKVTLNTWEIDSINSWKYCCRYEWSNVSKLDKYELISLCGGKFELTIFLAAFDLSSYVDAWIT